MQKTQDYTKAFQEMAAAFPFDAKSFQDSFKNSALLGEKVAKVALEAADKSNEISSKWAKDAIAKVSGLTKAQNEPSDYTKAVSDFASAAAEIASENLAAFAEVAKKAQMETVELMLAAGKNFSEDTAAAVKKAQADVTAAAKKATASVK
ncbi:MAG: Phasin [Rhodobacteraceae bacterium]|nr:Phasin [Paracoccaceae bacterium]